MGHVGSKTRSNLKIHSPENSGERPQGHHGPLIMKLHRNDAVMALFKICLKNLMQQN